MRRKIELNLPGGLSRYPREAIVVSDHARQAAQQHVAGEVAHESFEVAIPGLNLDLEVAEHRVLDLKLLAHRSLASEQVPKPGELLCSGPLSELLLHCS